MIATAPVRSQPHHASRACEAIPGLRIGAVNEFRLCERWTSSIKSVCQFDVQGSVAKSTHPGSPWLKRVRDAAGNRVHIWPFDGWQIRPTGAVLAAVLAEVYPSIFRNRYSRENRTPDEQDAYAVSRWLTDCAVFGSLTRYVDPPLTSSEQRVADGRAGFSKYPDKIV